MWTRWWLLTSVLLVACAPSPPRVSTSSEPIQILFIGSSYLIWHDAPEVCGELLEAGGQQVHVGKVLKPGKFIDELLADPDVRGAMSARPWDAVILQGGGMSVGYPESHHLIRPWLGYHPVEAPLRSLPRATWRIIFIHPWAFEDGLLWIDGRSEDYARMQDDIDRNLAAMAGRLDIEVSPVGPAWELVHTERPSLPMFADDKHHPSMLGSYLMACVITQSLIGKVPETERGRGMIPPATAKYLRDAARRSAAQP